MPIFTMLISIIGLIVACISNRGMIAGIALLVGFVADVIFWIILAITDKSQPTGFGIDWGA